MPVGCFDGAKVCELVGSYTLSKLKEMTIREDVGLYQDNGL